VRQQRAFPGVLKSPPLLAQLLLLRGLGRRLPGTLPHRLPSQGLIGLGLLVLVERGGHLRAGRVGTCEGVVGVGAFFRGAHATPAVVRPDGAAAGTTTMLFEPEYHRMAIPART
jgi:hypothetical protein